MKNCAHYPQATGHNDFGGILYELQQSEQDPEYPVPAEQAEQAGLHHPADPEPAGQELPLSENDRRSKRAAVYLSEAIFVGEVFHNVFDTASENVAELVDGVDFHIQIFTQTVELGTVDVVMGVQVILGHTPLFHRLPQTVIGYHS